MPPSKTFSPASIIAIFKTSNSVKVWGIIIADFTRCTVTVAGFLATNEEVALASFTFTPPVDPVTPVPMIHAVLEAEFLLPLYNVTFVQSNTLAALKVDNLHYEVST